MKKRKLFMLLGIILSLGLTACGDLEDYEDAYYDEDRGEWGEQDSSEDTGDVVVGGNIDSLESEENGDGWAVYWYLCGSDLESEGGAATIDLQEMLAVDLPENVKVIIETGGAQEWQNDEISADCLSRYMYDQDGLQLLEQAPLANMGEAQTLADFLYFAKNTYSADHTAVIFWNHGGGSLSGVAFDENYEYDSLSLPELYSALDAVFTANESNPPIDVLGFDTCLMATIDVANISREYAHYLVASEETEPGNGWYYTGWLQALAENPSMNGDRLGIAICSSFYEGCEQVDTESDVTLSVTDLTKLSPLLDAYEAFGNECLQSALEDSGFFAQFARCAGKSENYGGNNKDEGYTDMVDLGHLAKNTAWMIPSAQSVVDALEQCIVYRISGTYRAQATGLSCFYAYDNDSDNINTFCAVGSGLAFKYLYQYGMTGEVTDEMRDYLQNNLSIDVETAEISAPQSLADVDWSGASITIGEDATSCMELGPDAASILANLSFYLFCEDAEDDLSLYLGTDNNIICDWENGIFMDNFYGTWGCINGTPVVMELTYSDEEYNLYSVPVLINNEEYSLLVSYDYSTASYSILGARPGLEASGMASKEMYILKEGDVIDIIWQISDLSSDADFEPYVVESITVDDNLVFEDDYLYDGTYKMVYYMEDTVGNYVFSSPVYFTIEDGNITVTNGE